MSNVPEGRVNIESRKSSRLVLSVLVLVLAFSTAALSQLGMLVLPFLAGTLAAVFIIDNSRHRILSVALSLICVAVDAVFNLCFSFSCLAAVIVALLIARWLVCGGSKGLYVGISTLLVALFLVSYAFLAAFYVLRGIDFSAATEYLRNAVTLAGESIYDSMASLVSVDAEGKLVRLFSDELIYDLIDYYLGLLPSLFVIVSFALVGVANKVFSFIVDRLLTDGKLGIGSSFTTPASFAYFYIILSIFQIFESDGSVFSVSMLNLYAIFMVVYAYIGFRFVTYFLGRRIKKPVLAGALVVALTIIFNGFSLQLLSIVGTLETIAVARFEARVDDGNNDIGG